MKEKSEIKARYDRAANAMNYVVGLLCIAGVLLGGYLEQYIGVFLTLRGAVGAAVSGYASLLYRKVPKEQIEKPKGFLAGIFNANPYVVLIFFVIVIAVGVIVLAGG